MISLKGNIWRVSNKLSMTFLTLQDLTTIHVGITDLFNKYFKIIMKYSVHLKKCAFLSNFNLTFITI